MFFFHFRYLKITQKNPDKYCGRVVCHARTSCFAIMRPRVRTRSEARYFFFLFSVSAMFSVLVSSQLFQFIHLPIHFRCQNSEINIFIYLGSCIYCGGDVLATQCLLTVTKVSKCGVIHRGKWENCYVRDTKDIKMHQFCITKL